MPVVFFVGTLFLLYFFVGRSLTANGGGAKKEIMSAFTLQVSSLCFTLLAVVCCTQTPQMCGLFLLIFSHLLFQGKTFFENMNSSGKFWSVKPSVCLTLPISLANCTADSKRKRKNSTLSLRLIVFIFS